MARSRRHWDRILGSARRSSGSRPGDSVVVWNRTASKAKALEAKGATVAASAVDAVNGASGTTLSDDAARPGLLLHKLSGDVARRLAFLIHTTTAVAGTARHASARMDQEGFTRFVHAPVFMTPAMARGQRSTLLSGPREQCDRLGPLLAPLTGEVWAPRSGAGRRRCVQALRKRDDPRDSGPG